MTIQTIGAASVALYLTPADLREHGLTPERLTLECALQLTRSAFQKAGITLDGSIEIEAYPDACGVLVFAHVKRPERLWYSFALLDALLDGVRALPLPVPDGALAWWEGRWWVSLPESAEQAANLLSEFGLSEPTRPYLEVALAEHNALILPSDAFATLLAHFSV